MKRFVIVPFWLWMVYFILALLGSRSVIQVLGNAYMLMLPGWAKWARAVGEDQELAVIDKDKDNA